jgi:hypothetical protein
VARFSGFRTRIHGESLSMRRLAAFSLGLVMLLSLGIGAALLIGRGQAMPARIERLHLTDCTLPCWNGITPGVSSASEAKTRIDALLPEFQGPATSATSDTGSSKSLIWTQYGDIDRVVRVVDVTLQNGRVESLSIGTDHTSEDMPRLSEVLAVFGSPTCATFDARTGLTSVFYAHSAHDDTLQFTVFPLSLATPVNNFVFGVADAPCQSTSALSWHEFRKLQHLFFADF